MSVGLEFSIVYGAENPSCCEFRELFDKWICFRFASSVAAKDNSLFFSKTFQVTPEFNFQLLVGLFLNFVPDKREDKLLWFQADKMLERNVFNGLSLQTYVIEEIWCLEKYVQYLHKCLFYERTILYIIISLLTSNDY